MADKAQHGTVLVIDDHLGAISKETEAGKEFYDCANFESDYGHLPFRFVFSTAWDKTTGQYTVEEAIRTVETKKLDGILLDIVFGDEQKLGLDILRDLTERFPELPVVMMTSVARDEVWMECSRLGAVDYLPKPFDARLLWQTLDRYIGVEPKFWLIGQNSLFLEAINLAAMASEGGLTAVMITGESGTGKELIARFVHRHGKRSHKLLEIVFLPDIPDGQQADFLFGHSKGAYTGAHGESKGRFVFADGGVVFLDEIGDINKETQTRLLRVVDSGEVVRLGDGKSCRVDVQLITATNANLAHKIKVGEFRFDLWARLNGMHVALPTLMQRPDDILLLVRHMLRHQALKRGRPVPPLPQKVEPALLDFSWLTNVRGPEKYAELVFDLSPNGPPNEAVFFTALNMIAKKMSTLIHETPAAQPQPMVVVRNQPELNISNAVTRLQQVRLDELGLLFQALEQTRDPVTDAANRAKAAALLKGKPKCSTNEFDRWVKSLWDELTPENRNLAVQRFPELSAVLKDATGS